MDNETAHATPAETPPTETSPTVDLQSAQPAQPAQLSLDAAALFDRARELTLATVAAAEHDEREAADAVGRRLRAEHAKLLDTLVGRVPTAVLDSAAKGQRVAAVLEFGGGDLFEEFCYLYMIKGPYAPEGRAEFRRAGVEPLLGVLRRMLEPAGFRVWHSWQRATNRNALTVSW